MASPSGFNNNLRKALPQRGTFGKSSTGRFINKRDSVTGKTPSITGRVSAGPNLHTASRGNRRMSVASGNSHVGQQVAQLFNKTIDYSAKRGNACDERLAELIKELNIRMPIKMIEEGKYMIGTRIVSANLEMHTVMVRVGGGYREFHEYVKIEELELRRLQQKIEQTGLTLDQLVRKMLNAARHKKFAP